MILGVSQSFSLSATESQLSSESNALCAFKSCYRLEEAARRKGRVEGVFDLTKNM